MDFFAGYEPEQLRLIDQLRAAAHQKAAVDEAGEVAAETARRIRALGFWGRLYHLQIGSRFWSAVSGTLFSLSRWMPALRRSATSAGRYYLQPPALWPEMRSGGTVPRARLTPAEQSARKSAALNVLAEMMPELRTTTSGHLSIESSLQVEELARWVEMGAEGSEIREAIKRITDGEQLVETLRHGLRR